MSVSIKGKSQEKLIISHNFHIFKEEFDLKIPYFVSSHQRKITRENHHKPQFSYFKEFDLKIPYFVSSHQRKIIGETYDKSQFSYFKEKLDLRIQYFVSSHQRKITEETHHKLQHSYFKELDLKIPYFLSQFYTISPVLFHFNIKHTYVYFVEIFQKLMSSHYRVTIGILTILKLLGLPTIFKLFASSNLTSLLLNYLSTNIEAVSKLENR